MEGAFFLFVILAAVGSLASEHVKGMAMQMNTVLMTFLKLYLYE